MKHTTKNIHIEVNVKSKTMTNQQIESLKKLKIHKIRKNTFYDNWGITTLKNLIEYKIS